jgi:hypothetical protein
MIYVIETKKEKRTSVVADTFVIDKEINGVIFKDWEGKNVALYNADDIKSITKA